MGLGETQVFQDEKSRLANTTVARIVAAKGSLNDPETKKECCRKLQKLNATLKDRVAAVDAAMARDAMKGGVTGLGCDNRKLIAVLCTRTKASLERTKKAYREKFDADLAKDVREKTGSDYGRMMAYALAAPDAYVADIIHAACHGPRRISSSSVARPEPGLIPHRSWSGVRRRGAHRVVHDALAARRKANGPRPSTARRSSRSCPKIRRRRTGPSARPTRRSTTGPWSRSSTGLAR